jgi:hypothetical protein
MLGSSRVAQAITGAILVAGISATLVVLPSLHLAGPGGSPTGATGQSQRTADAQANIGSDANRIATATATASASVAPVAPTATPTRVPPTPTPIPVPGQTLTVRGTVTSVTPGANNTGTFVVRVPNGGGTYICTVTSSTSWPPAAPGVVSNINMLQVGMQVNAWGTYQVGGGLTASRVDADN